MATIRSAGTTPSPPHPPLHDDVDLDRRQAGGLRGGDAVEHPPDREVDVVHAPEDVVIEGVEADRHTPQARVGGGARRLRQKRPGRGRRRPPSGSPPVRRTFPPPAARKRRTSRDVSSKVSSSFRSRKRKSWPKTSLGMQYTQRKLQRSVTETRRSCSGRPRRSSRRTAPSYPGSPTGRGPSAG